MKREHICSEYMQEVSCLIVSVYLMFIVKYATVGPLPAASVHLANCSHLTATFLAFLIMQRSLSSRSISGLWIRQWRALGEHAEASLAALLYMCSEWHVISSKGLLVLWISVLELLNHRQTKSKLQHSAWLSPLSAVPIVRHAHAKRQHCIQEIRLKPPSGPYGYARGVIVMRCDSHIILTSQQVSLKWPACRGHLAALWDAAGCWDGL